MVKPIRKARKPLVALDTEDTGVSLHHGCLPFFTSICDEEGTMNGWEWDVDPKTRLPNMPKKEVRQIHEVYRDNRLVFHNAKFDVRAHYKAGIISFPEALKTLEDCEDTLIASHVLMSSAPHGLKDLAAEFLDISVEDQDALAEETIKARRIGKKKGWRIAGPHDPHWPHLKRASHGSSWHYFDTWLPRAIAKDEKYPKDHLWWNVLSTYGLLDAERTMGLWLIFEDALKEEGLWELYQTRKKLLSITFKMEENGITIDRRKLDKAVAQFSQANEDAERKCVRLANGKIDNLRSYPQLQGVLYGNFKLKPTAKMETKTGYSTNNDTIEELKLQVKTRSKAFHFMANLQAFRKTGKADDYLETYGKVSFPIGTDGCFLINPTKSKRGPNGGNPSWLRLFPNFNITGTKTTRLSSNDPNAQNISKKENFNLRQVFCPAPGRVWFALDYMNIELRIFAYQSGDQRLIDAFEEGKSVHLVIGEQLHPKLFAKLGPEGFAKTEQYRWVKNGNFALIYGAGIARANATYRVPNAYQMIRKQLPLIDKFMASKNREAKQNGFVTTLGGYRLEVPRSKPHAAVNYFVQGSAGWGLIHALIGVNAYLDRLGDEFKMIMTVHDEIVLDFPKRKGNIAKIRRVKNLMETAGDVLGLPTPVDCDLIEDNWANGVALAL